MIFSNEVPSQRLQGNKGKYHPFHRIYSAFPLDSMQHSDNTFASFPVCDTYEIVFHVSGFFVDFGNFLKPVVLNESMYIYICVLVSDNVLFFLKKKKRLYHLQRQYFKKTSSISC